MLKNYEYDCQPGQLNQPKNETRCKAGFEEKWKEKKKKWEKDTFLIMKVSYM